MLMLPSVHIKYVPGVPVISMFGLVLETVDIAIYQQKVPTCAVPIIRMVPSEFEKFHNQYFLGANFSSVVVSSQCLSLYLLRPRSF